MVKSFTRNVLNDPKFQNSRRILEGKAPLLHQQGKGKKPNASKFLSREEEEIL